LALAKGRRPTTPAIKPHPVKAWLLLSRPYVKPEKFQRVTKKKKKALELTRITRRVLIYLSKPPFEKQENLFINKSEENMSGHFF
jgi:hypothetical protein